jgi:putative peptidoglycan lipid II flippase
VFRSFWRATGLIASANAVALGLQFLTTILVAREFGATAAMDAYTLAVSIPESLQYLLMLATLSIVFTPLFIDARTQHGESEAWSMALSLSALVAGAMMLLIPLLAWLMPSLIYFLAPGFAPDTRALATELSILILPGLIYYATAGLFLGICYAYHDFTTAALNTLLLAFLNLGAFFLFVQFLQWGVRGMMLGRLLALTAMAILLVTRVRRHKKNVAVSLRLFHPRVWTMLTYLPPYMFGAVSGQVELVVNRSLISTLGAGSVAAWGYGQRLADIPMAVLGAAFGTTYLPAFAAHVASKNFAAANAEWNRAVLRIAFVLAPIAALLLALGAPLIAALFQRGAFDAVATQNSALVLAGLALGLPLRGVGGLVVRGMPAFKTRRLPLALSALSTGVSIAFAFLLLNVWGLFGVALAASLGDILFVLVGMFYFWRKMETSARATIVALAKIFLAAGGGGAAAWVCANLLQAFPFFVQVLVGGSAGMGVFIAGALALQISELRAAQYFLQQKLGRA